MECATDASEDFRVSLILLAKIRLAIPLPGECNGVFSLVEGCERLTGQADNAPNWRALNGAGMVLEKLLC